jgi:pyruvate dehydrogenase E2 component (dihydrolipoamide acetyltransferase)
MEVVLPKWGMTMKEATVVRWLREEGDSVGSGDPLVEVETDKVEVAVEAPAAGRIAQRCVEVGEVVPVGGLIAILEVHG